MKQNYQSVSRITEKERLFGPCLTDNEFTDLVLGEISSTQEMTIIHRHLDGCSECNQELKILEILNAALAAAESGNPRRKVILGFLSSLHSQ